MTVSNTSSVTSAAAAPSPLAAGAGTTGIGPADLASTLLAGDEIEKNLARQLDELKDGSSPADLLALKQNADQLSFMAGMMASVTSDMKASANNVTVNLSTD